jgi:cytochrome c-type biogenesis protein CcmE
MNIKIVLALLLLVTAAAFGFTSFKKSVTPYISFSEARRSSGMVQVNGVLGDKNYILERDKQYMQFKLKDSKGEVMTVEYHGVIPGNFDQAVSIVAIGRYANDRFVADQLLVKCPSKYQAEAERAASKT